MNCEKDDGGDCWRGLKFGLLKFWKLPAWKCWRAGAGGGEEKGPKVRLMELRFLVAILFCND